MNSDELAANGHSISSRSVGFWRRFGAYLIDGLILWVVIILIGLLFYFGLMIFVSKYNMTQEFFLTYSRTLLIIYFLTCISVIFSYIISFEATMGVTPGKSALGIQVFDINNVGRVGVGFKKAFLRQFYIQPTVLIAFPLQIIGVIMPEMVLLQAILFIVIVLIPCFWFIWIIVSLVRDVDPIYDRLAGTTVRRVYAKQPT